MLVEILEGLPQRSGRALTSEERGNSDSLSQTTRGLKEKREKEDAPGVPNNVNGERGDPPGEDGNGVPSPKTGNHAKE